MLRSSTLSFKKNYGTLGYVCIRHAMLDPVVLGPGSTWHGAQFMRNTNLIDI